MSAQSRGGGGPRPRAPLERWATLAVWSPNPLGSRGQVGSRAGRREAGPYASREGLLEEREGNSRPLLSPPTSQGGRPSSWSGLHRLRPALASSVSLPLELVEGLTCPDSSAGGLQRMWSWQPQGPSWVLCPLSEEIRSWGGFSLKVLCHKTSYRGCQQKLLEAGCC